MAIRLKRLLRTYAICFGVWTVLGLFFFTQSLAQKLSSREPSPWWHYLISWLIGSYITALFTPTVLWLSSTFPFERRNWLRRGLFHLVVSLILSAGQLALQSALIPWLGLFPTMMKTFSVTFALLLLIGFHQGVTTYWATLAFEYGLRYYRGYQERKQQALRLELQASELKAQLVGAQLSALNMQLQPHFLFNTLNAIMVLVRQGKASEAEEMLSRLSDLLRLVLDETGAQEVPLRKELEYLQLYLAIEQVRFQDRLRVEISADPAVLDAAIPHFCLQPIVENAIRHGIGKSLSAGKIQISALRFADTLEVTVRDDGPGLPLSNVPAGHGIGLSNTRARLQQLYGDEARLTLSNQQPVGAVATVVLPYRVIGGGLNGDAPELEPSLHALHDTHR